MWKYKSVCMCAWLFYFMISSLTVAPYFFINITQFRSTYLIKLLLEMLSSFVRWLLEMLVHYLAIGNKYIGVTVYTLPTNGVTHHDFVLNPAPWNAILHLHTPRHDTPEIDKLSKYILGFGCVCGCVGVLTLSIFIWDWLWRQYWRHSSYFAKWIKRTLLRASACSRCRFRHRWLARLFRSLCRRKVEKPRC